MQAARMDEETFDPSSNTGPFRPPASRDNNYDGNGYEVGGYDADGSHDA